ncbi:MAG: DUF2828 family protein [Lachnospiraceae bacterium]|nr:DUF2828 family protein [Lachnospiraceae bacterium]
MINYLAEENNKTYTENGAATLVSTGNDCVNLFGTIGAMRGRNKLLTDRFIRAYAEDSDTAMKILFFARDVRGGLGEREIFRNILRELAFSHRASVIKNIPYIAEYGRYDDLLALIGSPCEEAALDYIKTVFEADRRALVLGGNISLLAKWLPSINASSAKSKRNAAIIAGSLGLSKCDYRKALSALRERIDIIENHLREKDYGFDYEAQPSGAMFKYRQAFYRNDGERYLAYLDMVNSGDAKMHTDNLAPYEFVDRVLAGGYSPYSYQEDSLSPEEEKALNTMWDALPDYCGDENALVVVDTSGSMYDAQRMSAASVALSLGLYMAERNKGLFKDYLMEFSEKPHFIRLKGKNFIEKLRYLLTFSEVANTNLQAVFDLILKAAVKHNAKQEEMPSKLYIISDMEFDLCVENAGATNFENAKRKFEAAGYHLPQVIFWNVRARNEQQPVMYNEQGVALVSGASPRLFNMVFEGDISPVKYMLEVIGSKRYEPIVA